MTASATSPTTAAPRGWRSLLTGRWHQSSWVVALLTLLFLVFCNVPGQYVTCIDVEQSHPATDSQLEHGWPLAWVVRSKNGFVNKLGTQSYWRMWDDAPDFRWTALTVNILVVVVFTLLAASAFELWRRARARLWQIHLRDILVAVLLISLAGGWYAAQHRRHAREQRVLAGSQPNSPMPGVLVLANACGIVSYSSAPGGPSWLRELLGNEHFQVLDRVVAVQVQRDGLAWAAELPDVRAVKVNGDVTTASLSHLERLPRLEMLDLSQARLELPDLSKLAPYLPSYGDDPPADPTPTLRLPTLLRLRCLVVGNTRIEGLANSPELDVLSWSGTSADESLLKQLTEKTRLRKLSLSECTVAWHRLELLGSLPNLEHLELDGTTIDDENIKNLVALTHLRELAIRNCPFMGRGLKHLAGISGLESLNLYGTNVDNEAMQSLASVKSVRELNLSGTRVAADAIPFLAQMKQLRELSLSHSGFSEQERSRLAAELPECRITWTN